MLPPHAWKIEGILLLFGLMFIGLCGGMVVMQTAGPQLARWLHADQLFVQHIVSFSCLHGLTLIWLWIFVRFHKISVAEGFGFREKPVRSIRLGLGAGLVALPIALFAIGGAVTQLMKALGMEPKAQPTVTVIREHPSAFQAIVLGFAALVLAPVVEEAIFRGVLYQAFKQRGYPRMALWGTALLFAAIHVNLAALLPLTFLAIVFTWVYEKSGNLLAPIAAHALFNGVNFIALMNPLKWKWLDKFLEQ